MTRLGSSARQRPPQCPPTPPALARPWRRWMELVDDLEKEVAERKNGGDYIPFDTKNSYVKRKVYRYVLTAINGSDFAHLADIIEYYRGREIRFIGREIKKNPFYWVFSALKENSLLGIGKGNVIRYSDELMRCLIFKVPPQFVIAFINQYGELNLPPDTFNLRTTGNGYEVFCRKPSVIRRTNRKLLD
jgi:hypothetical protein